MMKQTLITQTIFFPFNETPNATCQSSIEKNSSEVSNIAPVGLMASPSPNANTQTKNEFDSINTQFLS